MSSILSALSSSSCQYNLSRITLIASLQETMTESQDISFKVDNWMTPEFSTSFTSRGCSSTCVEFGRVELVTKSKWQMSLFPSRTPH